MADKKSSNTGSGILPLEVYIKKIEDLQTENGTLQAKYDDAVSQVQDLKTRIESLQQLVANSGDSAERTMLQKQVQDLEKQLKGKEAEIKRLNSKLEQTEAELAEWKKMPNNSGEVLRAKEQEIERLQNELKAQAKSKTKNAPANESELADTQAKLDAKCIEIKNLTKDKTDLIRQTNDLTKKCNDLIKKVNLLEAEQTQDLGYNIIWGHIWKGLAVLLDVIVIWLFAYCSSGFITTATIMLVVFLTLANLLILAMRILHCISEFTQARFDTITLPANIFGSICLLAVFILIILVFGVGL